MRAAICRLKKLGRDFFKIVKARPANYDKQMRLGNAARNHCSSQGLSDFSLSLVLGFSLLPSCSRELNSVFVVIQPSFSRSTVSFSADARISLSAHHPFSPSCSLPLPPSRFAATRKRRLRHCGGEKVEEEKEEEAHRDSYLLLSLFLLFCLPAFSNGTFFFRCSASSAASAALAQSTVQLGSAILFSPSRARSPTATRRESTQIDENRRKSTQTDATPRHIAPRHAAPPLVYFYCHIPSPSACSLLPLPVYPLSPPLAALLPFFPPPLSFFFASLPPPAGVVCGQYFQRRDGDDEKTLSRLGLRQIFLFSAMPPSFLALFFSRLLFSPLYLFTG